MFLSLALLGSVHAGSLDNIEVGGPWGSPTATNPTALWWNPGAIAKSDGHELFLEAAPTRAVLSLDRDNPNGGLDEVQLKGVVPFAGVTTSLGETGFGLGAGLAIPMARGGVSLNESGSGRYFLREGTIQTAAMILGGGYRWTDRFSIGVAGHLMHSSWSAKLDSETMPSLYDEIIHMDQTPNPSIYNDSNLENDRYSAALDIGPLVDTAWTWSVGVQAHPTDKIDLGISYIHGLRLDHTGDATVNFDCPPPQDEVGRFGAESLGVCDTSMQAHASVGYNLPYRIHAGVGLRPSESVRLEAMGGFVGWSSFQDFELSVYNVEALNNLKDPQAADLVQQDRLWARDNQDTWFAGLDLKGQLSDKWLLGSRALYDRSAIPDRAVTANNIDANTLTLTGLAAFSPIPRFRFGLSYTHLIAQQRVVTNSSFEMTLDPTARNEDRWFYPHGNGTYSFTAARLGLNAEIGF